ncbi:MAG TPA: leucine-rich repeat domain-containing protein [Rhabdochlamydiaceae bacterium]|jgi:hypothetical protein
MSIIPKTLTKSYSIDQPSSTSFNRSNDLPTLSELVENTTIMHEEIEETNITGIFSSTLAPARFASASPSSLLAPVVNSMKFEPNYDSLPIDCLATCFAFTGSPASTRTCSKRSREASIYAYQEIVEGYKKHPLLAPIVARHTSSGDLNQAQYAQIAGRTRREVVSMAQAIGITVPNPEDVQLQDLITRVETENFITFFQIVHYAIPDEDLRPDLNQLTGVTRQETRRLMQEWMQDEDNQEVLETIRILNLSHLGLSYLPPEIGKLTYLDELNLDHNRLRCLPAEIVGLANLLELSLDYNQFQDFPLEICQLTTLNNLDLSYNEIRYLPPEIGSLVNLQGLAIEHNKLRTLCTEINRLGALVNLYLGHNLLHYFPLELYQLIHLVDLDLSYNRIKFIAPGISQLTHIQHLFLQYNHRYLYIPYELSQVPSLRTLYLDRNQVLFLDFPQLIPLVQVS